MDILSLYDINAWIHENHLYCVLCMEENNFDMIYPIFSNIEFQNIQHCTGCNAELLVKISDWDCVSCGTVNKHNETICGGCDFVRGKKLRD